MAYTITSVSTAGDSVTYLRDLYTAVNVNNDWYDSVVKDETDRTLTFSKDSKTLVVITVPSTLTASSGFTIATYGVNNNVSSSVRIANNVPTTVIIGDNGIIISFMYTNTSNSGGVIFTTGTKNKLIYGFASYSTSSNGCIMNEDDSVATNTSTCTYENKEANLTQLVPYITISDGTTKEWTKDILAVTRKENTSTNWSTMTLDNVQYITNNIIAMKA